MSQLKLVVEKREFRFHSSIVLFISIFQSALKSLYKALVRETKVTEATPREQIFQPRRVPAPSSQMSKIASYRRRDLKIVFEQKVKECEVKTDGKRAETEE